MRWIRASSSQPSFQRIAVAREMPKSLDSDSKSLFSYSFFSRLKSICFWQVVATGGTSSVWLCGALDLNVWTFRVRHSRVCQKSTMDIFFSQKLPKIIQKLSFQSTNKDNYQQFSKVKKRVCQKSTMDIFFSQKLPKIIQKLSFQSTIKDNYQQFSKVKKEVCRLWHSPSLMVGKSRQKLPSIIKNYNGEG